MNFLQVLVIATIFSVTFSKKDVLFIAIDDFRTELGAYGHPEVQSPNIDALATKSLLFERAYCQIAECSPSRASLLTSRRPDTNKVWLISPQEYWRRTTNATTIPQYFKDNGYVSIGMGKIFHPGAPSGNDDTRYSWSLPYFHAHDKESSQNSWNSFENAADNILQDGQIADQAISSLQKIKQNRSNGDNAPFFLAVGFHKPHLPFNAPSKYFDLYPPADQIKPPANPDAPQRMPPIAWSASGELRRYPDMSQYNLQECQAQANASMNGDKCRITGIVAQNLRRAYYAAVSYIDAQVGRILSVLESQDLADNTIIVLWGDHGYKLGEHNMWAKFTNMEVDARVPLLFRVPGVTDSGMRTRALVELTDIFPSLVDLAGIPVPPVCPHDSHTLLACMEGTSIAPLLEDPGRTWKKAAFSQFPRPGNAGLRRLPQHPDYGQDNEEAVMGYSVRTDKYRFVEWYTFNSTTATPDFSQIWATELYNHSTETQFYNDENYNMAAEPNMASLVQELRAILQAGWRAATPGTAPAMSTRVPDTAPTSSGTPAVSYDTPSTQSPLTTGKHPRDPTTQSSEVVTTRSFAKHPTQGVFLIFLLYSLNMYF